MSAGEWAGRVAAFLFAGSAAGLGVAILADWVASWFGAKSPTAIVAVAVLAVVALLFWRIFLQAAPADADATSDEEQS